MLAPIIAQFCVWWHGYLLILGDIPKYCWLVLLLIIDIQQYYWLVWLFGYSPVLMVGWVVVISPVLMVGWVVWIFTGIVGWTSCLDIHQY